MSKTPRFLDAAGNDADPNACEWMITLVWASDYVQLHDVETGDDHCVFHDQIEVESTIGYAGTTLRCIPFAVIDAARAMLAETR